jgi:epoxyqueuosine reductase
VVVCAINYNTAHPYSTEAQPEDANRGWISRYAWTREDYHEGILRRLLQVEGELRGLVVANGEPDVHARPQYCWTGETPVAPPTGNSLHFRSYVDTGPLIERVYAKYAGVGWIGKNTCIINQQLGSWLFLGVILTSLEFTDDDLTACLPAPDRCGTCTRCITACPTQAIVAPGELDARLCISYLTIEKRGEIPDELRPGMGRHVFGCDICQDVCPWNRKAPATSAAEFEAREGLVNPALEWLAEMQEKEFREVFRGSPIRRAKLSGLRRNAVIAMGNSGDKKFVPTLRKLCEDSDPVVAEHARWAVATLG